MWRCRRWVGEICGPCCRVKLISSSKCSSISCCLFYGCWGAFCINHLAIARTKKKTHYLTDLARRWPICKIKLTSQLSVFTSWIGKCFPKFFGEKHEPRVSWLFKSLVDITADRCFLIIHIKTNGRVFRLHLITPFFRIKNGNSFSPAIFSRETKPSKHRSFTMGFQNTIWHLDVFLTIVPPLQHFLRCWGQNKSPDGWMYRGWCGLGHLPICPSCRRALRRKRWCEQKHGYCYSLSCVERGGKGRRKN